MNSMLVPLCQKSAGLTTEGGLRPAEGLIFRLAMLIQHVDDGQQ